MTTAEFAETREQAKERAEIHMRSDPFTGISPGPLTSDAVAEYIRTTGMIFPFAPGPDRKCNNRVKEASISVPLLGSVYTWKPDGEKSEQIASEAGHEIIILRNSITYCFLAAEFRLPAYILMRFDLAVKHVHNGLLLGTGPIVDPTFQGRLFIPVHNLTNSDYSVFAGDEFIHCEFSKISPYTSPRRTWKVDTPGESDSFASSHYLRKIASRRISSSLEQVSEDISDFEKVIHKTKKLSIWGGVIGGFGLAVGIGALILAAFDLSINTRSELGELRERITRMEEARVSTPPRIEVKEELSNPSEVVDEEPPTKESSSSNEAEERPVQRADAEG